MHAGLVSKGYAGTNFHGASARPNASGGASNHTATMQPRSNNMQRLEAHFNTGRRGGGGNLRMDDPMDALGGSHASASVANEMKASAMKETAQRAAGKDKADRATVEQAIDPRTRMVRSRLHRSPCASRASPPSPASPPLTLTLLSSSFALPQVLFKMLNRGLFKEINGCVSTGKEANVYHAADAAGKEMAIKIYKTSILVFKDRDR
jgi:RIO kinase 1